MNCSRMIQYYVFKDWLLVDCVIWCILLVIMNLNLTSLMENSIFISLFLKEATSCCTLSFYPSRILEKDKTAQYLIPHTWL